jgi:hypothetical protein
MLSRGRGISARSELVLSRLHISILVLAWDYPTFNSPFWFPSECLFDQRFKSAT